MSKHAIWFWLAMVAILTCGLAIYFWPHPTATVSAKPSASATPVAQQSTSQPAPTPTPWRFPAGVRVAGLALGGMSEDVARASLLEQTAAPTQPLRLLVDTATVALTPTLIAWKPDIDATVAAARAQLDAGTERVQLPLQMTFDRAALRAYLTELAPTVNVSPTVGYSATLAAFVLTPGLALDVDGSVEAIAAYLEQPTAARSVRLPTTPITTGIRPTEPQIQAALAAREAEWGGFVGVAVDDLVTGRSFGYHADTVFSGMSVMKIPILMQAFISRPGFTESQYDAIDLMTRISDNDAANELLALIGAGDGLTGVETMNATLADTLGLTYTSLAAPFESIEYLSKFEGIEFPIRGEEGPPPFTAADPYVRTTPEEMNAVVKAIVDCADGGGPLLKMRPTELNPTRCSEMLQIMARNQDTNKIVAGVPRSAFVAHKSGWIDDCRADAGYVRDAHGNRYVVSLWIWQDDYIETEVSDPLLADLSRIVYTAFVPLVQER